LAKEGFVVVVVPYNVTFDHSLAAKQVYDKFHSCLETLLNSGLPQYNLSPAQLGGLPIFSVGHRYVCRTDTSDLRRFRCLTCVSAMSVTPTIH